jgi:hypothetical protein
MNLAPLLILVVNSYTEPTSLDLNYKSPEWQANIRRGLLPYHQLTVGDFRAVDQHVSGTYAYTSGFMAFQYEAKLSGRGPYRASLTSLKIRSGLDKSKTWYKRGLPNEREWLSHEQVHLDINEIAAYELASRSLGSFPSGTGSSPQAATDDLKRGLARFFEQFQQEVQSRQARYDKETHSGLNKTAQAKWKTSIEKTLKRAGVKTKWP